MFGKHILLNVQCLMHDICFVLRIRILIIDDLVFVPRSQPQCPKYMSYFSDHALAGHNIPFPFVAETRKAIPLSEVFNAITSV